MPIPTPFHPRTSALCTSLRWKDWAGYHAVCSFGHCHEPEYLAIRHAAGLLDISPLYKYRVTGSDAERFLSFVLCRDASRLRVGQVAYSTWCDDRGKILDDGTVTRLAANEFRVTSAEPAFAWFSRQTRGLDVLIEDRTAAIAALAIQGPNSRRVLEDAIQDDLGSLRFFRHRHAQIGNTPVEITRTGYTGDLGYELWVDDDTALTSWDAITESGRSHGLRPIGLDALDMTRVEAGFILHGVDYVSAKDSLTLAQCSTPYELDLGWTVHLDRQPFIGQQALREEQQAGSAWAFVGLEVDWDDVERLFDEHQLPPDVPAAAWRDARPVYLGRRQVGRATSGTFSPTLKKNLALATVESDLAAPGTRLEIEVTVEYERRRAVATVRKRPFFAPERKRA